MDELQGFGKTLRILFDDSPLPMLVMDRQTYRFVDVNAAAIQRYGYSREEFLRLTALDLRPPADVPRFLDSVAADAATPERRGVWRHRTRSGEIVEAEILVQDFDVGGRPRRLGVALDVSERSQLRNVLGEVSTETVWEWDIESGTLWWGRAVEQFGYRPEELESGVESWNTRIWPDDRERVLASLRGVLAAGTHWREEYRFRRADGSYASVLDRGFVVRDSSNKPTRMIGAMSDLSRIEEYERRIGAQSASLIEQSDHRRSLEARVVRLQRMESIGALAGGLAHDLNNFLTPIPLAAPVLRERRLDPEGIALLDLIEASARRAAELVGHVLALGSDADDVRAAVEPGVLVRTLARVARETLPRSIEVSTNVDTEGWRVRAVPSQAHQVLLNLVINARDAMPTGGQLTLTAKLERRGVDGLATVEPVPYVVFAVADTGSGIEPEVRDRLFEPLFTTKTGAHATGLGLSTALAIARQLGGFVEVESEVGRGSTFRVFLPAEPVVPEPPALSESPDGAGRSVLVVHPDAAVRAATRWLLDAHGYHTVVASDGGRALALFGPTGPHIDLVIVDMGMQTADGAALTAALRQRKPALPIIVTNAAAPNPRIEAALESGPTHVLDLPCAGELLLAAVAAAVGSSQP